MKKFIAVVVIAMMAAGGIAVLRHGTGPQDPVAAPRHTAVSVMAVLASNIETCVMATGNAEAYKDVQVCAQVAEKVMAIAVNEGDVVTAGQVLAELDVRESRAALEAASRTVDSVESGQIEAGVSLTNAVRNFGRVKNLKAQNVVGQQQFDESETAMKIAQSRTALAAALLSQARAKERELGVQVERCTVRAPFDGVIAERNLDPGAFVSPGTPLVRLVKVNPLSVKVQVPEGQTASVKPGCPARVMVQASHPIELTGTVVRIYPAVDQRWRTQTVELECPNHTEAAAPGMFASASIVVGCERALLVPDIAVIRLPGSGITHVYVVQTDTATRVDVTVTKPVGAMLAVRGAFEAGQDVVVKGQQRLQSGMVVEPVRTEMLP